MAALSIRGLDEHVRDRLRVRAARHGRSMEAEIRAILVNAVSDSDPSKGLYAALVERFGAFGGVELVVPPRTARTRAADLSS